MESSAGKKPWAGYIAALIPVALAAAVFIVALHMRGAVRRTGPVPPARDGFPRNLTETEPDGSKGRTVVIPAPPQRIVSVTLGADEILLRLVPTSRIAALSIIAPNSKYSPVHDKLNGVTCFVGQDTEKITSLNPDLCFMAPYVPEKTRNALVSQGIPVFSFRRFRDLDDIRRSILTVGRAVAADKQARRLVREMDAKLCRVARRLPPKKAWPLVLFCWPDGSSGGLNTTYTAIMEAAGARNVVAEAGVTGYPRMDIERIMSLNPDRILLAVGPGEDAPAKNSLINHPALADLPAIKNKRFIRVSGPLFSSVSQYAADAVVQIAAQLHPERP